MKEKEYKAIVIGVSAGGMNALLKILSGLPDDFPLPIIIAQHLHPDQDGYFIQFLSELCKLKVKNAEDKDIIQPGVIYFAPPDYHLLVDENGSLSLSTDEKVNYSRPSIDVLFNSASDVYSPELMGVILTGANDDGTQGMRNIKENGGLTIAQDPATAEYPVMPKFAINAVNIDYIIPLDDISKFLVELTMSNK